jgi:hypothetical protein
LPRLLQPFDGRKNGLHYPPRYSSNPDGSPKAAISS